MESLVPGLTQMKAATAGHRKREIIWNGIWISIALLSVSNVCMLMIHSELPELKQLLCQHKALVAVGLIDSSSLTQVPPSEQM